MSLHEIMPVPSANLSCCYLILYYKPNQSFLPKGDARRLHKTHQKKKPQPHKTNVSMCFALIQPTRKETVHTPTGIDRMKKKKTLRERQELCIRAVPACSTCRGTSALILEEYCNPEFPNPPPNRSRVSTGAAIMQVMPLEG